MTFLFGYLAVIAALGLIICFKGRDLFRPAVAVVSFIAVYALVVNTVGDGKNGMITALIAGVIAALASGAVLKLGVFIIGLIGGVVAGSVLQQFVPIDLQHSRILFIAVCAIIFGLIAIKFLNIMISICTALSGAPLVTAPCTFLLINLKTLPTYVGSTYEETIRKVNEELIGSLQSNHGGIVLGAAAVLFLVGLIVQMKTNKKAF